MRASSRVIPACISDLLASRMRDWRHELHAHPELAFRERWTAAFVAERLTELGLEVHEGVGGTGVVATLRSGSGSRSVALRAELDALPLDESTAVPHRSLEPGRMHACGHDGHMAMLLGAAQHLAESRRFDGVVHFVFQPAEENDGGARALLADGLFDRFACDAVFGLHNWPGLELGHLAVMPGPMMAASGTFEIVVVGRGAHAAQPHRAIDPILVGSALVQALQSIVSRAVDPAQPAVVSVTQLHAGEAWNAIPDRAVLRGTTRSQSSEVQRAIQAAMVRLAEGIGRAHGAGIEVHFHDGYPATVNGPAEAAQAAAAGRAAFGADRVHVDLEPSMASEDFSCLLERRPGAYAWLGAGLEARSLHSPTYDFEDALLPLGAAYWVTLVEQALPR
jgi:amidohydrolase